MTSLLFSGDAPKTACPLNVSSPRVEEIHVPPATDLAVLRNRQGRSQIPVAHATRRSGSASQNSLDTIPVEIVSHILSYLVHPRSHLPGLTEAQSDHDISKKVKMAIKSKENLTKPSASDSWAADLFTISFTKHPFNALSLTSRRCRELVESYCSHRVRACNPFNLPFARFDKHGSKCVWPDLSGIVYRRLWLQHAPRKCVYCEAVIDQYPFPILKRLITGCEDCFYRLTLSLEEIELQYHISKTTIVNSPTIRGNRDTVWFLRTDVEALALQLYGTRAFHAAHPKQFGKPCSICAITRFKPEFRDNKSRSNSKIERRGLNQKKRSRRSVRAIPFT
ncbi:hypothetical protein CC86DRAFT_461333 [Ophiobolus disseminans]|uniref:Uncharacterized protein n=1 Tax=Ophiobolus disseminans TaxID=1469910 RepID=A0A6A7AHZ0_9PLEO|nr:hypothetical protein CC86DRAFT_461333 [Ophiobolus disseminans]